MHADGSRAHPRWYAGLAALLSCLLPATFAHAGPGAAGAPPLRHARPGDLALTVALLARDGSITAYEPLLARVTLRNQAQEAVEVGIAGGLTTRVEIRDARGNLVAATPRQRFPYDYYGLLPWSAQPGEARSRVLVISGLYQFTRPGNYAVRVQQLALSPEVPVLAGDTAAVRVLPFNAVRLDERCDELFRPWRTHNFSERDLPMEAVDWALYSVRHDIALPYLDWLAREQGDRYAVEAMRRIGTPRAVAVVKALAARTDDVGKTARQALKTPLKTGSWGIGGW